MPLLQRSAPLLGALLLILTQPLLAATWKASLSGSHRSRIESLENQFRPQLKGSDQALQLRTLIRGSLQRGRITALLELQDSRSYLDDEGSWHSTINVNTLAPLQALMRYTHPLNERGDHLDLSVGRFTLDLGGRRLVARNRYRNTIQNYTGLLSEWHVAGQRRLTVFWSMPVSIQPAQADALQRNKQQWDDQDPGLQLWGLFHDLPLSMSGIDHLHLESYIFGLHEEDEAGGRQTADRELYTPGFRLHRPASVGHWDIDVEFAWQRGTRRRSTALTDTLTLPVHARFQHIEIGYTVAAPWSPRWALEHDMGTGGSTADAAYRRFDGLYGPRRAEFGPTGIYGIMGRENIHSTGISLSLTPDAVSDLNITWRHNRLDRAADSFARSGASDPAGASGKTAGDQLEFRYRRELIPERLDLEVGGAWFRQGAFLRNAPNSNSEGNPRFFYADLTLSF